MAASTCWLVPAAAEANTPVPFASMSGSCSPNAVNVDFGNQAAAHSNTVVRLYTTGGTGDWDALGGPGSSAAFGQSDVQWEPGPNISPGTDLAGWINCNAPLTYTVQAFDTPTTPTSFSGATTPNQSNGSGNVQTVDDDLQFISPGTAQYVADVSVQQGGLFVWTSQTSGTTVASHAIVSLGTLGPGVQDLSLSALDGPQAVWTVAIRALPVVLTGPNLGISASQPGAILRAAYNLTGDGTLTANVLGPQGGTVRSLASNLAVGPGDHTLTWDGLDINGSPVRDGTYNLAFAFIDAAGNRATKNAAILIDSAAPTIKMISGRHISRMQGLVIKVTDGGSGVASASLSSRNGVVIRLHSGNRLIYRPRRGWQRHRRYQFFVNAGDKVGNSTRFSGAFIVR